MCGIAGCFDLRAAGRVEPGVIHAMTGTLVHRGPDSSGCHVEPDLGLGIRRLKIIDLATGDQPIANEDGSVVMVCNGEIFNYRELRAGLAARGHAFRTRTDVEVLVHLYEELGPGLVHRLNGQFAFAIYDRRRRRLLLARDPFGVNPLFYARFDDLLLFGSEVKAILRHPAAERRLDLVGLDQVLSLPGLVSPRTAFAGVESLRPGHTLLVADGALTMAEYWDLDYPELGEAAPEPAEGPCIARLAELFTQSVERRLLADVPVGLFVSGGLDSSLVAAVAARLTPGVERHSFSITFADQEIDETRYQRLITRAIGSRHHEIRFEAESIAGLLRDMVRHCECPVKETFDTCNLALAAAAREAGIKVVLAGQGADELFGGYPGYRFDGLGTRPETGMDGVETALEEELRERLWGDRLLFYEKDQIPLRETKLALYSSQVVERFTEVDCLNHPLVNRERLRNRHPLHQRSYLDSKLRLADHLLSDHGDRMVMASSVEARYPFLDVALVDFVRTLPPAMKVRSFTEKYIIKKMSRGLVPDPIIQRDKFGFRAPGIPLLLQRRTSWVEDLLSSETVRRRGVFNPAVVEKLRKVYSRPDFRLQPHLETDLLMVVLTVHILFEEFALSGVA
ncbi:MAG TPA: asparagine synthase (glutamine-hydrolyzing) [Thermoanaerobaculia bacterium]|jgi:asparagine synthase (glutamine-hydrolysing)|nr:asparagine synthase (glutamine-hydrolyzing) [Thermoanaerobaculia bacterium]